jgi:hypothetical protein
MSKSDKHKDTASSTPKKGKKQARAQSVACRRCVCLILQKVAKT